MWGEVKEREREREREIICSLASGQVRLFRFMDVWDVEVGKTREVERERSIGRLQGPRKRYRQSKKERQVKGRERITVWQKIEVSEQVRKGRHKKSQKQARNGK